MKLEFEYGQGLLGAELPDSTDIFIPGETVADPPCLPQDWDSLYAATLASIRNPIGMPPLKELAGPGKSVVIVIPDIVKGGNQPTSHRKVAIRACLDELYAAFPAERAAWLERYRADCLTLGRTVRLLRDKLRELEANGISARSAVMVGGPSENPLWVRVIGEMTGLAVRVMHGSYAGAMGAAMVAGIAAGLYRDEAAAFAALRED